MFGYCGSSIKGVNFTKIGKQDMAPVRQMLVARFKSGKTFPGTRSYHQYSPLS